MPENAFDPAFLDRFREADASASAQEASAAGPWRVVQTSTGQYGVLQEGEEEPLAVFHHRETALLAAAVSPGEGRETLYALDEQASPGGYPVHLAGEPVGALRYFHPALVAALNTVEHLVRSPVALAAVLEAAGGEALTRAGAILAERVDGDPAGAVARALGVELTPELRELVEGVRDKLREGDPPR